MDEPPSGLEAPRRPRRARKAGGLEVAPTVFPDALLDQKLGNVSFVIRDRDPIVIEPIRTTRVLNRLLLSLRPIEEGASVKYTTPGIEWMLV